MARKWLTGIGGKRHFGTRKRGFANQTRRNLFGSRYGKSALNESFSKFNARQYARDLKGTDTYKVFVPAVYKGGHYLSAPIGMDVAREYIDPATGTAKHVSIDEWDQGKPFIDESTGQRTYPSARPNVRGVTFVTSSEGNLRQTDRDINQWLKVRLTSYKDIPPLLMELGRQERYTPQEIGQFIYTIGKYGLTGHSESPLGTAEYKRLKLGQTHRTIQRIMKNVKQESDKRFLIRQQLKQNIDRNRIVYSRRGFESYPVYYGKVDPKTARPSSQAGQFGDQLHKWQRTKRSGLTADEAFRSVEEAAWRKVGKRRPDAYLGMQQEADSAGMYEYHVQSLVHEFGEEMADRIHRSTGKQPEFDYPDVDTIEEQLIRDSELSRKWEEQTSKDIGPEKITAHGGRGKIRAHIGGTLSIPKFDEHKTAVELQLNYSVEKTFKKLTDQFVKVMHNKGIKTAEAYRNLLEQVYARSQVMVPRDTGRLAASGGYVANTLPYKQKLANGRTVELTQLQGAVYYGLFDDPPYAMIVHEDTTLKHKPPTSSRFLERALQQTATELSIDATSVTERRSANGILMGAAPASAGFVPWGL